MNIIFLKEKHGITVMYSTTDEELTEQLWGEMAIRFRNHYYENSKLHQKYVSDLLEQPIEDRDWTQAHKLFRARSCFEYEGYDFLRAPDRTHGHMHIG